jgi:hypothetical protein
MQQQVPANNYEVQCTIRRYTHRPPRVNCGSVKLSHAVTYGLGQRRTQAKCELRRDFQRRLWRGRRRPFRMSALGGPADDPSGLKNSTRLVRAAATAIRPSAVNPIAKISAGTIHEPTGFEAAIAVIPLDSGWRDRCRKCPARRPNDAGGFEKRRQFHVSQPGSGGRQQGSTKKTQGAKPKALSPRR